MYRQGLPTLDLYIERGTDRTPRPGLYYVFLQGTLIGHSRTLQGAQQLYQQQKETLGYQPPTCAAPDVRQALIQETQDDYLDRADAHWARSAQHRAPARPRRRR